MVCRGQVERGGHLHRPARRKPAAQLSKRTVMVRSARKGPARRGALFAPSFRLVAHIIASNPDGAFTRLRLFECSDQGENLLDVGSSGKKILWRWNSSLRIATG